MFTPVPTQVCKRALTCFQVKVKANRNKRKVDFLRYYFIQAKKSRSRSVAASYQTYIHIAFLLFHHESIYSFIKTKPSIYFHPSVSTMIMMVPYS